MHDPFFLCLYFFSQIYVDMSISFALIDRARTGRVQRVWLGILHAAFLPTASGWSCRVIFQSGTYRESPQCCYLRWTHSADGGEAFRNSFHREISWWFQVYWYNLFSDSSSNWRQDSILWLQWNCDRNANCSQKRKPAAIWYGWHEMRFQIDWIMIGI